VQGLVTARRRQGRCRQEGPRCSKSSCEALQRTLDDLQHRIDTQVRQSVERVASHPAPATS
jgi:hypothetical protein